MPGSALYQRKVQCVLTRAGAERASHFAVEFDPSCEAVEIHVVRILRSGETIDHAAADRVQIFRRETNLERLALNGRLTASLLIPDVRIGDIVETALTISGRNPALGEKFAGWAAFDDTLPWFEYRYRCLRPAGRTIAVRSFRTPPPLQISVEDGVEEVHCTLVGPPRREVEELALPWLVNAPALQFSEFQSWGEVSCLFAPYYATGTLPDSVATVVDRVRDEHKTAGDRAAAWLRFVQREVRYFALSLGEGGYVPRQLGEIWGSRFGDCKDAAQLYVAGARRLGIDACAALTSTTHGQGLAELLPAPILFNHCIVRLRLDGQTYWLDPTMPQQGGGLARIFQPHSGWALALSGQDDDLESINGQEMPIHYLNIEEEVEFEVKPTNPARLRRQYEYYSWAADQIRNAFADGGSSDYTREKLKELQAVWPQVREAGAIVIQDDPVDNCLTTILCYEIPDCWTPLPDKRLQFAIQDIPVAAGLAPLKLSQRTTDIYLGRPRKVSHRIRLKMPRKWAGRVGIRTRKPPGWPL